jgi:manganese efflux pump family protein
MFALVLAAASVGLSNFAAAIAIGVSGVDARKRIEVGVVFGIFEIGMPIVGLVIGHSLSHTLGTSARWLGGGLLIATGLYGVVIGLRRTERIPAAPSGMSRGRLVVTGAALSIDNLVIGFALGAYHVSVIVAALVIGLVSVGLSLIGLELGARIGSRTGDLAEVVGSAVLMVVGVAICAGLL